MKKPTYIIIFVGVALLIAVAYIIYPKPANHVGQTNEVQDFIDEDGK